MYNKFSEILQDIFCGTLSKYVKEYLFNIVCFLLPYLLLSIQYVQWSQIGLGGYMAFLAPQNHIYIY